jgi:hypothetical protein
MRVRSFVREKPVVVMLLLGSAGGPLPGGGTIHETADPAGEGVPAVRGTGRDSL